MGAGTSRVLNGGHLRRAAFPFAQWPLKKVQTLLESLKRMGTFVMVPSQFCSWISTSTNAIEERDILSLFELLDSSQNGRVNCLEFLAGVVMLSNEDFATRTQFCFDLYDFNLNGALSRHELVLMVRSTVLGTIKLLELDPAIGEWQSLDDFRRDDMFEHVADQAIRVYDKDATKALSYGEFLSWARGNREVMSFIETLTMFSRAAAEDAKEAKTFPESPSPTTMGGEDPFQSMGGGDESFLPDEGDIELRDIDDAEANPANTKSWSGVATSRPSKSAFHGHLEIDWVYGYSGKNGKHNVKYVSENRETIVYPAGCCAVVQNTKTQRQVIYCGHTDAIVAIEVHPSKRLVASVDKSGEVHIWNCNEQHTLTSPASNTIFKCSPGEHSLSFNASGQLLAVGTNKSSQTNPTDKNHVIDVWDWTLKERVVDPIYCSGTIHQIAWAMDDDVLAAVGHQFAKLFTFRDAESYKTRYSMDPVNSANNKSKTYITNEIQYNDLGNPMDETFFSVCFLGKNLIVGTGDGELFQIDRATVRLEQVVQAHSEKHAVTCLHEWSLGLVSGAEDGELKLWDMGLYPLDSVRSLVKANNSNASTNTKSKRTNSILLVSPKDPLSFVDTRITSLSLINEMKSKIALIGMRSGEVFEVNLNERTASTFRTKISLVHGHAFGTANGFAVHKVNDKVFATCCAGDSTLRIWDAEKRSQINAALLESPGTCVAYSPMGDYLAVGMVNGKLSIHDPSSRKSLQKPVASVLSPEEEEWIGQDGLSSRNAPNRGIIALAFSPDGNYLASTCASGSTYLFSVKRQGQMKYKRFTCIQVLKPSDIEGVFGSKITKSCLDWSFTSQYLRVTLGDRASKAKQYYWDIQNGGNLVEDNLAAMQLLAWDTLSAPSDDQLKGLPSKVVHSATCFDATYKNILAFGDREGNIGLTKFPVVDKICTNQIKRYAAQRKKFPVSQVRFVDEDTKLLSSNENQDFFVQWKVVRDDYDDDEEEGQSENDDHDVGAVDDSDMDSIVNEEITYLRTFDENSNDPFHELVMGDECLPNGSSWRNTIVGPTDEEKQARLAVQEIMGLSDTKKDADIKLEWAEGFQSAETHLRKNVHYLVERNVAYPCSGLVVVTKLTDGNANRNEQTFLQHQSKKSSHLYNEGIVTATAVTKSRTYLASAKDGSVVVWEAATLNVVSTLSLPWTVLGGGVSILEFSPDEELLLVVGTDHDQTVAIYDWKKERLQGSSPGGAKVILDVTWFNPREFVCVGPHHVTFWFCNDDGFPESRRGMFNNVTKVQNVLSCCVVEDGVVATGLADGTIGFWKCSNRKLQHTSVKAGTPVYCLCPSPYGTSSFFSAGKDGVVCYWSKSTTDNEYEKRVVADFKSPIRSIDIISKAQHDSNRFNNRNGMYGGSSSYASSLSDPSKLSYLVVGTRNGQVIECKIDQNDLTAKVQMEVLAESHGNHESWGLAAHPTEPFVATVGDDSTIKVWDLVARRRIATIDTNERAKTICFRPPQVQPDGSIDKIELAVGLVSGAVCTYEMVRMARPDERDEYYLNAKTQSEDAKDWIQIVKYSPTGAYLGAGSHDQRIYIYDGATMQLLHKFSGHSSYIFQLDWSVPEDMSIRSVFDGTAGNGSGTGTGSTTGIQYLQSNCGGREILYWDVTNGVRIKSNKALRDVQWDSWTCLYGYDVSGIPDGAISCCARSQGGSSLIAGSKHGSVLLYPYPYLGIDSKEDRTYKRYKIHGSMVSQVTFAGGDKYVVTLGSDGSMLVWSTENVDYVHQAMKSWYQKSPEEKYRLVETYKSRKERGVNLPGVNNSNSNNNSGNNSTSLGNNAIKVVSTPYEQKEARKCGYELSWKPANEKWMQGLAGSKASSLENKIEPVKSCSLDWVYGHSEKTGGYFVGPYDDILFTSGNVAVVQKPIREGKIAKQSFFLEHEAEITAVTVANDMRMVGTGDETGTVFIFDSNTMLPQSKIQLRDAIRQIVFSLGGKLAAAIDAKGDFYVFSTSSGSIICNSEGEVDDCSNILLLPRSEGNENADIDIVTLGEGSSLYKMYTYDPVRRRLTSKSAKCPVPATFTALTEFADGVVTGHKDGTLVLWNRDNASVRRVIKASEIPSSRYQSAPLLDNSGITQLLHSRDRNLIVAMENGDLVVVDSRFEIQMNGVYGGKLSLNRNAQFISISANGSFILYTLKNGTMVVKDVMGNQLEDAVVQCGHSMVVPKAMYSAPLPWSNRVVSGVFEANSQPYMVSAGDDNQIHLFDIEAHRLIRTQTIGDNATAVAISPSGHHITIGTKGGAIIVFSSLLARKLLEIVVSYHQTGDHSKDAIRSLAYSPDGNTLAVGCDDSQIRLLETRNYALLRLLPRRHKFPVTHLDWSSDNAQLCSNSCIDSLPKADLLKMVPKPDANEYSMGPVVSDPNAPVTSNVVWKTRSCPLSELTLSLWDKAVPVSSAGHIAAAALFDGTLVSTNDGSMLTPVRHRGVSMIHTTSKQRYLLSSGVYDGIHYQYKFK